MKMYIIIVIVLLAVAGGVYLTKTNNMNDSEQLLTRDQAFKAIKDFYSVEKKNPESFWTKLSPLDFLDLMSKAEIDSSLFKLILKKNFLDIKAYRELKHQIENASSEYGSLASIIPGGDYWIMEWTDGVIQSSTVYLDAKTGKVLYVEKTIFSE